MNTKNLNPNSFLARKLFDEKALEKKATRDGYGQGLVEAGRENKNIVVLCTDVTDATRSNLFKEKYPDRFIQMGVSEQSLASIAAGMALTGKTPFMSAFAAFSPGRNWEQIKTCIATQRANVKIAGSHAGISIGPDGATHQMLEDLALMRVMPNMTVITPCDALEAQKATVAMAKMKGPAYIRFTRYVAPVFTTRKTPFKIGKAEVFKNGKDVTIIACGPLVYEAMKAARDLEAEGIEARVINCHTIKPLDSKTIIKAAKETGAIITLEDAQAAGGLGGAVAECLAQNHPVPIEFMGIKDRYGESGPADELLEHFELTAPHIINSVHEVIKQKRCLCTNNAHRHR
ncbi:MAG: transketolase C-terminal domain-containing protein [Patescibacteria group bacterium]